MPWTGCQNVTIAGVGLLGGSVGLALRKAGFTGRRIGVGRTQATLDRAIALGCIDEASDLETAAAQSDLILLAAPVGAILDLLHRLAAVGSTRALITDVGSTKHTIVAEAERVLPEPGRFVGSHPMAGSERGGPDHATADLFRGKPVAVTPTETTDPAAIDRVEGLWRALGMVVHRFAPAEHDRAVARLSHLPHALSVVLMDQAHRGAGLELASTGLADMTRIAAGDPGLWADIFIDNADAVLDACDEFELLFDGFRRAVREGDRQRLSEVLEAARAARLNWRGESDRSEDSSGSGNA